MASVNFLYRSKKENSNLTLRLLFRHNGNDYVFASTIKLIVSKYYWDNVHTSKRLKDIDLINQQNKVKNELNKLETYVLKEFNNTNPNTVNKEWLNNLIDNYYNPTQNTEIPAELSKYFDYYLKTKKSAISVNSIKMYNSTKKLVKRYENYNKIAVLVKDVNLGFKDSFTMYCLNNAYAPNTIAKTIKIIKTICLHAKDNGIETSPQLDRVKAKYHKIKNIYLNFDELQKIENTTYNESLSNVKDWLMISCYTGQRVSDFMKFTSKLIRVENNKSLIEFTQKKTNKKMTIPLHPKVLEILNKRNGQFPKPISEQKYNEYIKEVCKIAGITEMVQGSKKLKNENEMYRKETRQFPKYELVTSHIGRRSFATNFYGQIPTSYLIYVTGHSTETMFLQYIGKSNKDLALEITNYF